jgi:hypothetical protein
MGEFSEALLIDDEFRLAFGDYRNSVFERGGIYHGYA